MSGCWCHFRIVNINFVSAYVVYKTTNRHLYILWDDLRPQHFHLLCLCCLNYCSKRFALCVLTRISSTWINQSTSLIGVHIRRVAWCANKTPWYIMPFISIEITKELSISVLPSSENTKEEIKGFLKIQIMQMYWKLLFSHASILWGHYFYKEVAIFWRIKALTLRLWINVSLRHHLSLLYYTLYLLAIIRLWGLLIKYVRTSAISTWIHNFHQIV